MYIIIIQFISIDVINVYVKEVNIFKILVLVKMYSLKTCVHLAQIILVLIHSFKKELDANSSNLTAHQKRLVDLYLLEGKLNGMDLSSTEKAQLLEIAKLIKQEGNNFRQYK